MSKFSYLPKEQSQQIAQYGQESYRSAGDLASQYGQGIDESRKDLGLTRSMIGSPLGGMSDALERRISGEYQREQGQFKKNLQLQAVNDRFARLQSAATLTANELQYNAQVRAARAAERANRRRARAGVVGNVLGIAGAVEGAGFGPTGALVGYQLGQGTGNLVGGM